MYGAHGAPLSSAYCSLLTQIRPDIDLPKINPEIKEAPPDNLSDGLGRSDILKPHPYGVFRGKTLGQGKGVMVDGRA
jgi:hypothetical protein